MERFGHYLVGECLGAGGMAIVHRAQLELEDGGTVEVALKRLLPQLASDRRLVEDFIREAKLASRLDHPHIARILEAGRFDRTYFIAMELVHGLPLDKLLRRAVQRRERPPIGIALSIGVELCDALDYAHAGLGADGAPLAIVHRDLSPSNLLVADDGHLKVIDFGVAKALIGALQTSSGLAKGKLGYMSFEAISGKQIDARTDIFSTGVVLWELICARQCFTGDDPQIVAQIRDGAVTPPSHYVADCPPELDAIVLRALARDPKARFQSAAALGEALGELRDRSDASAYDVARWARSLRRDSAPRIPPRFESDNEETELRLSASDLEAEAPPDELARGSRRAEPYDDELPLPPAKFAPADTLISAEPHEDPLDPLEGDTHDLGDD